MIQQRLFNARNVARAVERKAVKKYMDADKHDTNNRRAADVILADLERYGGEQSLMVRWARAFCARIVR